MVILWLSPTQCCCQNNKALSTMPRCLSIILYPRNVCLYHATLSLFLFNVCTCISPQATSLIDDITPSISVCISRHHTMLYNAMLCRNIISPNVCVFHAVLFDYNITTYLDVCLYTTAYVMVLFINISCLMCVLFPLLTPSLCCSCKLCQCYLAFGLDPEQNRLLIFF